MPHGHLAGTNPRDGDQLAQSPLYLPISGSISPRCRHTHCSTVGNLAGNRALICLQVFGGCQCSSRCLRRPAFVLVRLPSPKPDSTRLSGQEITDLIAGATVEIDTPLGTKLPIRYAVDGKLSGQAGDLASYLGAASDTGRWWATSDQLCHRWNRWFDSEPQCLQLRKEGRTIRWQSQDGNSGTAAIAVPAPIEVPRSCPEHRLKPRCTLPRPRHLPLQSQPPSLPRCPLALPSH